MNPGLKNPFRKELFEIPNGIIYLDGNSLGALPKSVIQRGENTLKNEWGKDLIKAWNSFDWIDLPIKVGNKIARLINAPQGSVVVGDTLSIKVYQALCSAIKLNPKRKVILSDTGNFPTDLYIAEGLINLLDDDYELKVVAPEQIENAIDEKIAALLITEVDFRTGRLHDVNKLIKKAHQNGVITIIDLAHSAGAIEVDVIKNNCDFAVGCTYKYLNGGPGSPAFIYVRNDLIQTIKPSLSGWMGHYSPFAFDLNYKPAMSIERMKVGTPSVIQLSILDSALDVFDGISMKEIREKSIELSQLFIESIEKDCKELTLVSPKNPYLRGSQVSFEFEYGYATIQALIENNIIGDYREPNLMRFGFTPLYLDENDVLTACEKIKTIIKNKQYLDNKYHIKNKVT